jgi:hypothetical protein
LWIIINGNHGITAYKYNNFFKMYIKLEKVNELESLIGRAL